MNDIQQDIPGRMVMLRSDKNGNAYKFENQPFSSAFYYNSPCLDLDNAVETHKLLGFGASLTDASCYLFSRMPADKRAELFDDLFTEKGLNLNIGRLNIGSSDYATKAYSYDDGEEDLELKNFSIDHDRQWIIPMVREIMAKQPDLYIFASPWSPPAWMKTSGSLCGGYMRAKYLPVFADYMVKYVQAFQAAGVPIHALTMQNEPDAEQNGTMPQSLLHPDFEMELVGHLMPPRLKAAGLDTKLWLYDHNYKGWKRVLYMLSDPEVRANVDSVAFHPYCGTPDMMLQVREKHPDLSFQMTEMGPSLTASRPLCWWSNTICGALNNGTSSFVGWNYILNELGNPNLGYFDCAGMVEINSQTGAISHSDQYNAFRHFAPYAKRGASILRCPSNVPPEHTLDCTVFRNPDGTHVIVMGNRGTNSTTIQFKYRGEYLKVKITPETMLTACF